MSLISEIQKKEIEKIEGVKLLDVDPGKATNRTVVTLVGEPQAVIDAVFAAIKKASEVIDMRHHKGEHPRMGALDVCPFIPVQVKEESNQKKNKSQVAIIKDSEFHITVFKKSC